MKCKQCDGWGTTLTGTVMEPKKRESSLKCGKLKERKEFPDTFWSDQPCPECHGKGYVVDEEFCNVQ